MKILQKLILRYRRKQCFLAMFRNPIKYKWFFFPLRVHDYNFIQVMLLKIAKRLHTTSELV